MPWALELPRAVANRGKTMIARKAAFDAQQAFRDELRAKYPGRAKRALGNGKAASIELFCIECIGGSAHDAKQCESRSCFLWPHGFGRDSGNRGGTR